MKRRAFLLASAFTIPPIIALSPRAPFAVGDARAAVSVLLSLDELVSASTFVVVATAGERVSRWEDQPTGKRIVTYTKLTVERAVVGEPAKEIWVRTLGGVVGKIGQSVPGEAHIATGTRAMLFLAQANSALVPVGMAQGHYPIVTDDKGAARLTTSPDPGMLLPRRGPSISAQERLVGGKLDEAIALVIKTRRARDANP